MENTFNLFGKKYKLTKRGQRLHAFGGLVSAGFAGAFMAYVLVNAFFG